MLRGRAFGRSIAWALGLLLATQTAAALPATPALAPSATPTQDGVRTRTIDVDRATPRRSPPRPVAADRPVRIDGERVRAEYADLSDALAQTPGIVIERIGGFGHGTQVRVRGATTGQTRWALDGVALESPLGRPFDVEQLPLGLLDEVRFYPDGAPFALGGEAMGGAVDLRLSAEGRSARVGVGRYGAAFAEGLVGWDGGGAGVRVLTSTGDFRYLDDGGTAFETSDDRARTRRNNAVFRLGAMLGQRVTLGDSTLSLRWLGGFRRQGLAGAAGQPTRRAQLQHHRHDGLLQLRRGHLDVQAHLGVIDDAVDDADGELGVAVNRALRLLAGELSLRYGGGRVQLGSALRVTPALRLALHGGNVAGRDLRSGDATPSSSRRGASIALAAPLELGGETLTIEPRASIDAITSDRADDPAFSGAWQRRQVALRALTTARLALKWRPIVGFTVHAGATRAIRPPTLLELFGNDGTVRGNAQLRDERSDGVDAAIVAQRGVGPIALDARIGASLRRQTDLIALVRSSPASAIWLNVAQADLLAWEAALGATLANRLRLSAQFEGLRAEDSSGDPAYAGRDLPLLPRSRWRVRASVPNLQVGAVSLTPFAAVRWRAGRFADRANLVVLPPRTRVDSGVGLVWQSWRLDLRVDNVLDANDQDLLGFPLPGRSWLATLTWKFDGPQPVVEETTL